MIWLIIFGTFWSLYLIFALINIFKGVYDGPQLIQTLLGFIGLSGTFLYYLYHHSLTFYIHWSRFINWFRNYPSRWRIDIRFDGDFKDEIIKEISDFVVLSKKKYLDAKIYQRTLNSINFSISETLNFYLDLQHKGSNGYDFDTIDISLSPFEIGSNNSKHKLNTEIIPILIDLQKIINPNNTSFVFNVKFLKYNPFHPFFIARLKSSQIETFRIDLKIDKYSKLESGDFVSIDQDTICLTASDVHGLKELSNDFIYLSSGIKNVLKDKSNA